MALDLTLELRKGQHLGAGLAQRVHIPDLSLASKVPLQQAE